LTFSKPVVSVLSPLFHPRKCCAFILPLLDFDSLCYVLSLSCYFPGAIDPSRQSRRHTWRLPRAARPNPTYTLRLPSRRPPTSIL
jgi:hypothetical protein